MCEIDGLLNRIKLNHDPLDKRLLERIIILERDNNKLRYENEKLKPFEVVAKSLVSA